MKLRLEIKCSDETSIGKLVKIFFEDSKTSDYIEVKNSTVKLEIEENEGDERKKKIIEAIDEWKNVTLNYGILSDSACEERNQSNEVETKKEEKKYQKNEEVLKVPKLEVIAKKSGSFKEFIELTAEWLEMGDYKELFYNVVMAATESEKVTWREMHKYLENIEICCEMSDKEEMTKKIHSKVYISLKKFLEAMKQYKYVFKENSTQKFTNSDKPRIKMECMPEIEEFEETLTHVDKTLPVSTRIETVLLPMGLEKLPEQEKNILVDFSRIVIEQKKVNLDNALEQIAKTYNLDSSKEIQLKMSQLLNSYVQKYDKDRKVKTETFFTELQKVIM